MIPPSIHFKKGNPKIKFDEWNIRIPTELTPWPSDGVRRVSTNSFGYGGTNAHAVIDDAYHYLTKRGFTAPHYTKVVSAAKGTNGIVANGNGFREHPLPRLFVWSAQDKDGLRRVRALFASHVEAKAAQIGSDSREQEEFLSDLASTLSERRSRLQWKTYSIASSLAELSAALGDDQSTAMVAQSSRKPRVGFIFTGQLVISY